MWGSQLAKYFFSVQQCKNELIYRTSEISLFVMVFNQNSLKMKYKLPAGLTSYDVDSYFIYFVFQLFFFNFCSDVVDLKRECHGSCQHTSCQACSWVDPDPDCGACASDDFRCIKRFAKCIKRNFCSRQKFPCKQIGVSIESRRKIASRAQHTSLDKMIQSG